MRSRKPLSASSPPELSTLEGFLQRDVLAGISVALVLIPQSLAYAALAGLPPVYGLYASVLPPIAAAFFASSRYLQTGPVAITSLLTLAALSPLAIPGNVDYLTLAPLLALVVGVCRLAIGLAGAGFVAYLLSQPVLTGFTSAAALLIVASQLAVVVGLPMTPGQELAQLPQLLSHPAAWSPLALAGTALTVAIILLGRRIHLLFPGVLLVVVLGILGQHWAHTDLALVGPLPAALPHFGLSLDFAPLRSLLLPGLVIAVVGFAEPTAIARTLATQTRQAWSANRELISQGVANVAAACAGAFPVGGSFSRTMVNHLAGGFSRWSGAVTGVAVLLFLPFAGVLAELPRCVLAGIVITAVLGLFQPRALWRITQVSRAQGAVAWGTFALTLGLAPRIDQAVGLGVGLAVAVHLWRERRIALGVHYDATRKELRLTPVGVLYFGSANVIDDALGAELVKNPQAIRVVFDLRRMGRIDFTGAMVLFRIAEDARLAGLQVQVIPGEAPQGERLLRRVFGAQSQVIMRE